MGCEIAQWKEWDFENALDWALLNFPLHDGVRRLVADLNHLYQSHPTWALTDHDESKFQWIDCDDRDQQTLSFARFGTYPTDTLLVTCNFSGEVRHRDWGCPHQGKWQVVIDSDSPDYGGWGGGGSNTFHSVDHACHNQPFCLSFAVGRWSVRILKYSSQ